MSERSDREDESPASDLSDRTSDHHRLKDVRRERARGLEIELCPDPVQDTGEKRTGGRREDEVRDVGVGEPQGAERIDVALLDRGRVQRNQGGRFRSGGGPSLRGQSCSARSLGRFWSCGEDGGEVREEAPSGPLLLVELGEGTLLHRW